MGHRDFEPAHFDVFRALCPAAVEKHQGLAPAVREDFDIPPADAADAGAERFHHGLLGGETGCQFRDAAPAVGDLVGRVDAVEEAVSVARDDVGDPVDFDDVDAVGELAVHARRIVRESRGSR